MLITGAGGFACQLLDIAVQLNLLDTVVLYDDVTVPPPAALYERVPVLHTKEQVTELFKSGDNRFVLGVANHEARAKMTRLFRQWGGELVSFISPHAMVSALATSVKQGVAILTGAVIENGVLLEEGVLINVHSFIAHGTTIGNYTEIAPGARLLGNCTIGSFTFIGAGAIILPGVMVGNHAVVAAGAVVTQNVPDGVMVAGVPATVRKKL